MRSSRPSIRRSLARFFVHVTLTSAASLAAAGCGEPPPAKPPTENNIDATETAKIKRSDKLMADANRALSGKSYDKARRLLREASALGVESHRYEISEIAEKVDKRQAKLWGNEMSERFKQKDCAGAFKEMAEQMEQLESEVFSRELRKLTLNEATTCVTSVTDEAVLATNYAEARNLVNAPSTRAVLGPAAQKKIAVELDATITDALRATLSDDIKEKHWKQAMDKLNEAVKKGDADEAQAAVLLEDIRKALAPDLDAMLVKGIGARDAATVLKVADTLIKLVRWEVLPPDVAQVSKDKALPAPLVKRRESLAAWVEGQRAAMKLKTKPEKRWAHGKVMLFPPSAVDGESKRDLAPATEVWVIAQTKEKALVTDSEPGAGGPPAMFEKVLGWVPVDRLAVEPTASWIPPNDQLKGVRVWAPLRAPDPNLELGVVADVQGKDIQVKRLSDDKIVKVQRKQLRSGVLAPGTKVLAFCTAKDQQATIEEVLTAGRSMPSVRIKCEGGTVKEEFLPGLRAKPEFLPASK
ncbi:MAG TPA: hypothetical protein VE093_23050 [Polyangiaceae bacterium]|nr:hypothetical protein [Polyangiaceae bacterium]